MFKYVVISAFAAVISMGCASMYTSTYNHDEVYATDSLNEHRMSINDVISLSKAGVGDSVIINQIKATQSFFHLSNDDILNLKKAGVSDDVVNAMITGSHHQGYYGSHYYYPWYYDPYYYGFSYWYYRPFYTYQHYYYPRFYYQPPVFRRFGGSRR